MNATTNIAAHNRVPYFTDCDCTSPVDGGALGAWRGNIIPLAQARTLGRLSESFMSNGGCQNGQFDEDGAIEIGPIGGTAVTVMRDGTVGPR